VLAWRIDAFLSDAPESPQPVDISPEPAFPADGAMIAQAYPAYESGLESRRRLAALAVTTLGSQLVHHAQTEAAWPALIAALHRAENTGYSPADSHPRCHCPRTAQRPQHQRSPRLAHQPLSRRPPDRLGHRACHAGRHDDEHNRHASHNCGERRPD
jgi:hypothetical protein